MNEAQNLYLWFAVCMVLNVDCMEVVYLFQHLLVHLFIFPSFSFFFRRRRLLVVRIVIIMVMTILFIP